MFSFIPNVIFSGRQDFALLWIVIVFQVVFPRDSSNRYREDPGAAYGHPIFLYER